MNLSHFRRVFLTCLWSGALLAAQVAPAAAQPPAACPSGRGAQLSLDGVSLVLCTAFLTAPDFTRPDPANALQIAAATTGAGRALTISAIPDGTHAGSEALPRIDPRVGTGAYLALLARFRQEQGGQPQPAPVISVFGEPTPGLLAQVELPSGRPALLAEWVARAGRRVWILLASQLLPAGTEPQAGLQAWGAELAGLSLISDDPSRPSTSATASGRPEAEMLSPQGEASLLATPAWWQGTCDTDYYFSKTGIQAYPLGAVYRGMQACGPRPWADGSPDVLVNFFPYSWGEYEWECVELTMRFLYLAYGIAPYRANGNQVVHNYPGSRLVVVWNGTPGRAPLPDDVLSYCDACEYGHTSVVSASAVDASGNGTVTVIEQNNSPSGASTLKVKDWVVQGNAGPVSAWLHDPGDLPLKVYLPFLVK